MLTRGTLPKAAKIPMLLELIDKASNALPSPAC
jgi:hypothetical protein